VHLYLFPRTISSRANSRRGLHGYRHSYQFGVVGNGGIGEIGEGEMGDWALSRREAAHLILTLVSRLGVCWNRAPEKLPGWGEGL
jgi:hypothetical protein